jgi:sRNA-binding protein
MQLLKVVPPEWLAYIEGLKSRADRLRMKWTDLQETLIDRFNQEQSERRARQQLAGLIGNLNAKPQENQKNTQKKKKNEKNATTARTKTANLRDTPKRTVTDLEKGKNMKHHQNTSNTSAIPPNPLPLPQALTSPPPNSMVPSAQPLRS